MTIAEVDKKQLSLASGVPTSTEALVKKACKTILGLPDAVLATRGFVAADIKALAEQIANPDFSDVTEEAGSVDLPQDLTDSGEGAPVTDESDDSQGVDNNPGNLTYEDVNAMPKKELVELAKGCGLPTSGSKGEIFATVVEYLGLVD